MACVRGVCRGSESGPRRQQLRSTDSWSLTRLLCRPLLSLALQDSQGHAQASSTLEEWSLGEERLRTGGGGGGAEDGWPSSQ